MPFPQVVQAVAPVGHTEKVPVPQEVQDEAPVVAESQKVFTVQLRQVVVLGPR
jgi:hypothetical protein